jgi:Domain found in Dishevelled, Egl-10, and Pleckstrin (DEP)
MGDQHQQHINNGDLHFRMLLDNFSEAEDDIDDNNNNKQQKWWCFEFGTNCSRTRNFRSNEGSSMESQIYKNIFVGSEVVDYLVRSRYAFTRAHAVTLGRMIAKQFNLFEHVHREHELKDEHLFYKFIESGRRTRPQAAIYKVDVQTEEMAQDAILLEIATILRRELDIRDRFYRLKRHRSFFVASDAVTFMVRMKLASTRKEAVELGRRLENELGLWRHVVTEHNSLMTTYSSNSYIGTMLTTLLA